MASRSVGDLRLAGLLALRARKGLDEQGRLLVEGLRVARAARSAGVHFESVVVAREYVSDWPATERWLASLAEEGVEWVRLPPRDFSRVSYKADGVVAVVRPRWPALGEVLARPGLVLALDAPSDPGNVGAVIRTANAWGAAGVVVLEAGDKLAHPKCVRASMGAVFHTPCCAAPREALLATGRRLVALVPEGERSFVAAEPDAIVVLGNEKRGVHPSLVSAAARRVALPMTGVVDSLNVSNAAAVVLWDAFRAGRTP